MTLTEEDVTEFQRLYEEAYGVKLPAAEAREIARNLLELYRQVTEDAPRSVN